MDLLQNRLLGEHHRASSTMHLLWRDFQQFVVIKVSHYIRRVINWSLLVVVSAVEIVQGQWMKSIIHLRISVCDPLTQIFLYTLWGYPHMTSIINYLEFWCLNFLSEIILNEKYSCLMCWSKEKLTLEVISGSCLSHAESYSPHNHMQWFRRERITLFNLSNIHFSFTLHSQMWPIMGSRWMRVSQKILLPRRPSLKRIPMVSITYVRVLTT